MVHTILQNPTTMPRNIDEHMISTSSYIALVSVTYFSVPSIIFSIGFYRYLISDSYSIIFCYRSCALFGIDCMLKIVRTSYSMVTIAVLMPLAKIPCLSAIH